MKYLYLIRAKHWIKNLFLFSPLFFAADFFNLEKIINVSFGFLFFSLAASSIYIINDFRDRENDRFHPIKRLRPLASGSICTSLALTISVVFIFVAFIGSYYINSDFLFVLVSYYVLNLAYSFGLKNFPIIDVFIISIGFVLRIQAGAILGDVLLSVWLNFMVFLLALFLALGKRRDDVILQLDLNIKSRKSIEGYNLDFVNFSIILLSSVIIVCYIMYTVSPEVELRFNTNLLYYTCFFVLMGVLRYIQLIFVYNDSGSPVNIIYKDKFLQIILLLWILSFYFLIYIKSRI
uniref:UbiA prenyltransferase family protein n=1 Tax=Algoriphagus sp. TaxID=1872435 RepID=UPI004047B18F